MFAHAVLGLAILPVIIFFLCPTIGVDRAASYPPLYATEAGLKSKTYIPPNSSEILMACHVKIRAHSKIYHLIKLWTCVNFP
jgi:hypothetical protein